VERNEPGRKIALLPGGVDDIFADFDLDLEGFFALSGLQAT
jgi:hypothetical protein